MKNKTHESSLNSIGLAILVLVIIFSIYYSKWYICDRDKEIQNRELQEMESYHRSEDRAIKVFEQL